MHHRQKHWRQSVHQVNCPATNILYQPIRYASTSNWVSVNLVSCNKEFGLTEMNESVIFILFFVFVKFIFAFFSNLQNLFTFWIFQPDSSSYKMPVPRTHAIQSNGIFKGSSYHAFHRTWKYCSAVWCGSWHRFNDASHWIGSFTIVARMPQRFWTAC